MTRHHYLQKNKIKPTCRIVDFVDPRVKLKESKKKDIYQDLAWKLKKKKQTLEHENDSYTNSHWCSLYSHQRFGKKTREFGNKRTSGVNPS